ncbi:DUF1566 domain-containing protein [Vibrio gallaecicus]|uniref:Lcl C-terminal domain-containing protein n=1 Tax=Vibrio gallaecicus TaxID=552386 RepID=UPI0010C95F37|nr:DUF1566 domain-containing protein [Vibrio gallaecicus]MDN3613711.1 DUF1566 domain-containing protein [Vibrio gallaecicus]
MKLKYYVIAALAVSGSSYAQTCVVNQPASQDDGQFIDRQDGTILDIDTNLLWAKCSLGETYTAETNLCSGVPTSYSTFQDALVATTDTTLTTIGSQTGFRLPNIKELGSIVDYRCTQPAINLSFFPTTINAPYWTNTPDNNGINSNHDGLIIDFTEAQEVTTNSSGMTLIRLVKELN